MTQNIIVAGAFTTGTPATQKTGLTVTVDVYRLAIADLSVNHLVTAQNATPIAKGVYAYLLSAADLANYIYYWVMHTDDDTVSSQDIYGVFANFSNSGGAGGAFTVTLTVRDANTLEPLPDVLVTIKNSADTAIRDQARTDADGQVVFSKDAATYKVHIAAPGYTSQVNDLTVSANTPHTYDLDPIAIDAPSSPDLCRVFGYEYLNGDPVQSRQVIANLINAPQTTDTVILERTKVTRTTDADGYWFFDLVIGKRYRLFCEDAGLDKVVEIPNAVSVDARTFL